MDVIKSAPPGLATMRTLFTGNKKRNKELMVLRVRPAQTRFPANSLYTPVENTPLHSIPRVCHARGAKVVVTD